MNLRWRAFERQTRRTVLAELHGSELLWAEHQRARKAARRGFRLPPWCAHLLFLAIFAMMSVAFILDNIHPVELVTALIVLWTLGAMFWRAHQLNIALYYSPGLHVFNHLPIIDEEIFRAQWRHFLRLSLWSAADFFVAYGVLAVALGLGIRSPLAGIGLGVAQWLFIVAGAHCLFVLGPRHWLPYLGLFFMASAIGLLAFGWKQPMVAEWLCRAGYWIPSLGWILYCLGIAPAGVIHGLFPCVLAALLLALASAAYRRTHQRYVLGESTLIRARQATTPNASRPDLVDQFTHAPAEAAAAIESRQFLAGLDWSRLRWVERLVARLLGPRERPVAEFLVAGSAGWTPSLRSFLFGVLLPAGLCWIFPPLKSNPIFIFSFIGWGLGLLGNWRGFTAPQGGGWQSPYYALYPIGFWEMARVLLKVNLVRFILYLPLLLGLTVLLYGGGQFAWLKLIAAGLILQPLGVMGLISTGTNESLSPSRILAGVVILGGLFGAGFVIFRTDNLPVLLATSTAAVLVSATVLFLYGLHFNRGRFDLLVVKPEGSRTQ